MVVDRYRYWGGIEEQFIKCKNLSSIYPPAVEKLSRRHELSRSIHQVLRSCQDCDVKKLKELDRQLAIEEVQNSFLRSEKHRHECNPTCNSTNNPINILSSQKHLSTIIFKHMDLKNTHTLNKSNQFYISKTKSR